MVQSTESIDYIEDDDDDDECYQDGRELLKRIIELAASDILMNVYLVGKPYYKGKDADVLRRENRNPWMGE